MMRFLFILLVSLLAGCAAPIPDQSFMILEQHRETKLRVLIPEVPPAGLVAPSISRTAPPAPAPAPAPMVGLAPAPVPSPAPDIDRINEKMLVDRPAMASRRPSRTIASAPPVETISDQMIRANMVFSIDERRNISELVEAQLVIGLAANGEITVVGSGQVIQTEISVGRIIIATLTANDFDVKLIGTERQPLVADRNLQWQWQLKPRSAGTFPITLVVISEFEVAGGREKITLESYRKTVEITITKYQIAKLWFTENWKWLSTTVVIPVIVWLWNRRSKKRRSTKKPSA